MSLKQAKKMYERVGIDEFYVDRLSEVGIENCPVDLGTWRSLVSL